MYNQGIDDLLAKFGATEKAAMRLMIDLPSASLQEEQKTFLSQYPWSGIILFPKNIENQAQVKKLIGEIQSICQANYPEYPLFIAVDQEGGSVSPLDGLLTPSPGNMALAATQDVEKTYQLSRLNGQELRSLGFNVNFAPVVDVNSNPQNPIIGIRSFGEVPETVALFGCKVIEGYQSEGIMATAKHFPGHGDTSKDSHLELPVVDRSRDTLEKIDFLPFEKAISCGVWGIMTAHVIYPGLDSQPATLSTTILTEILRKKMGFEGIIFTDSFDMAAIKDHFDLEEAVIASIKAGADILLSLENSKTQIQMFEILKRSIEKGIFSPEELLVPLKRILSYRKKLGDFKSRTSFAFSPQCSEKLHAESVTIVNGRERLPITSQATVLLSPEATTHLPLFQKIFSSWKFISWPWGALPNPAPNYTLFFTEKHGLSSIASAALESFIPHIEAAVAFGNPYLLALLPQVAIRMTTYHFNEMLAKEVYQVLREGKKATGKLPISL